MNAVEIQEAVEVLIQQPYEPKAFILGFMAAYGASATTITRIKSGDGDISDVPQGVLWKKWVHFQPAVPGEISKSLDTIQTSRKTAQAKVRFAVTTDGDQFAAHDLKTGELLFCPLAKLDDKYSFFLPIAGIDRYDGADENPVDVKASRKLSRLYDALIAENPDWETDARRHDMNKFMTRVIFCLFAEDTGVFQDNIFSETLTTRCTAHPENIASTLETMFEVMNLNDKDGSRDGKPSWACAFPYVNGGLFAGSVTAPEFDWVGWRYLRDAGKLDWRVINPDIFGSMIQSIVKTDERGELGMHYTSVPNILKVLNPLFLDGLREEVEAGWGSKTKLQAVLKRLMRIRVFDPACGSGNFLVIAYREMRDIEITVINRLKDISGEAPGLWSHVELKNFYGIEIGDFAAETAKLALWIAQHQMNKRFETAFGKAPVELPLREGGQLICDDALNAEWGRIFDTIDWDNAELYICGNPPYLGNHLQNDDQQLSLQNIYAAHNSTPGRADYVTGWFIKASALIDGRNAKYAFVTTNSICQGIQVPIFWGLLRKFYQEIYFAHADFKWSNNAKNNAAVICSIIGLRNIEKSPKFIYTETLKSKSENINYFLIDAPSVIIKAESSSISRLPKMDYGNKATDGGNLILSPSEMNDIISSQPESSKFIKRYYGSEDFINGLERYCIWVSDDQYDEARLIPALNERFEKVRKFRSESKAKSTRDYSVYPYKFRQVQGSPQFNTIIIPRVSSERRPYLPTGYLDSGAIVADSAFAIYDVEPFNLSIIASRLHLVWIACVCGKLKNDFRYSSTLGWNTFPVPTLAKEDKDELSRKAEGILIARETHFPATLADLYDPDNMPLELVDAHRANDDAIEKIYIGRGFKNDTERLEHLFKLYTKMVTSKSRA